MCLCSIKSSNFLMHGGLGGVFVPFAHGLEGQFGLLHARSIRCSHKSNPDCARTGVAQGLGPVLGAPGTTPTRQQRLYTPEYPACIPYLHLSFITTSLPTLSSAWIFGAPIRIPNRISQLGACQGTWALNGTGVTGASST